VLLPVALHDLNLAGADCDRNFVFFHDGAPPGPPPGAPGGTALAQSATVD
jgi:hypothetical protein